MAGELKVADIARRHGVDRKTAYRWMVEIERTHGARVIGRRGKRGILFTTEDAFAQVAPLVASRAADERRIRELEERVIDAERRADKQAEELSNLSREFRKAAARWFARGS